jgi:hypothetical protein
MAEVCEALSLAEVVGISAGAEGLCCEVLTVLAELLSGGVIWNELSKCFRGVGTTERCLGEVV